MNSVFPNLNKDKYIQTLRAHINNPSLIQQGANGTCGAAVICKYLADKYPDKYATAAISLYETGKYEPWKLGLPEASYTGTDQICHNLFTTSLDALMHGGIINGYNNVCLDYNPFSDGQGLRSFAWPQCIQSFFTNYLNKEVMIYYNVDFEELKKYDFKNEFVIAAVITKEICKDGEVSIREFEMSGLFPDHYIQLTGRTEEMISYWNWGSDLFKAARGSAYIVIKVK